MRSHLIAAVFFSLIISPAYAGFFCDSPADLENKVKETHLSNLALKEKFQKSQTLLDQTLSETKRQEKIIEDNLKLIGEKDLQVERLQYILDERNTVERNMQFTSNGVNWSWINLCDSLNLIGTRAPFCNYTVEEVRWAKTLLGRGLPSDISGMFHILLMGVVAYCLAIVLSLAQLFYGVYLLIQWVGPKFAPPLRYVIDKSYKNLLEDSYQKDLAARNLALSKKDEDLASLENLIKASQKKKEKLDVEIKDKIHECHDLNDSIKHLKARYKNIVDEKIPLIISLAKSYEERLHVVRSMLSGDSL